MDWNVVGSCASFDKTFRIFLSLSLAAATYKINKSLMNRHFKEGYEPLLKELFKQR